MAEYRATIDCGSGYEIDIECLQALVLSAQRFLGVDPRIRIALEGGDKIEGSELELLVKDPYVQSKFIESINIDGRSDTRHMDIELFQPTMVSSIQARLSGDRDATVAARHEIELIIAGKAQWWSKIKSISIPIKFFTIGAVATLVAFLSVKIGSHVFPPSTPPSTNPNPQEIANMVFAVSLFAALVLIAVSGKVLFPAITFDIGRSSAKIKRAANLRNLVGYGIVVAAVVGLFVNFVWDRIK